MTKQLKIGIGLILASVILLVGVIFFSREGIRRSINEIRAERLYKQAQEAFAGEIWADVVQKGRAAYYLKPDDMDIQLLVAQALLKQRSYSAVSWWELVLDKPDLPVEDLRELTRSLLMARMYKETMPFLERLVELDANNEETQKLWLSAMQGQRHIVGSQALATYLVQSGSEDWSIHRRYLEFQQNASSEGNEPMVIDHLKALMEQKTDLSVLAARELAMKEEASVEDQLLAAELLAGSGDDPLDALLATGLRVKNGIEDGEVLQPALEQYLASGEEEAFKHGLEWAIWMRLPGLYLELVDWETYSASSAESELYLRSLMASDRFQEVVDISQEAYAETDPESIVFLAYRAAAYRRLGLEEQANSTLAHAIQVVDPGNTDLLEQFLVVDRQWDLLVALYESLLNNSPDDTALLYRYLAALYYIGEQDKLSKRLQDIEIDEFEGEISAQAFIGYLKLVVEGVNPEIHNKLETLMSQYPEIYDFRLVVGMSYLFQGNNSVARLFSENMPDLDLRAPRHLRVSAAILENSMKDRLGPGELEFLLPRERYLLSRLENK